ncbi:MAG: carbohydrate kinase [Candidatus Caldarchaeales archaeon]
MIFAIGEVLIDFIAVEDADLKYVRVFEKHAGGAPANMVVGLRRLNIPAGLISKVGEDALGEFLLEELKKEDVDIRYVKTDYEYPTGVVFVQLRRGKPSFLLYDKVAYFNLKIEDVDFEIIKKAELIHFGGVLLSREPSRTTTLKIAEWARGQKIPVSFDVNIRLHLWKSMEDLVKTMRYAFELSSIVKLGEDELELLIKNGADPRDSNAEIIAITKGNEGSTIIHRDRKVDVPPYRVEVVDTTGAGDAYMAALIASLYSMNKLKNIRLEEDEIKLVGSFSNLVAAISTTKRGAWSTPRIYELKDHPEISPIVERLISLRV